MRTVTVLAALLVVIPLTAIAVAAHLSTWRRQRERPHTSEDGSSGGTSVREWARDRHCVLCGAELNGRGTKGDHVALLDPGGGTRDWTSIPAADLPLALATCLPVCWNCHIAETFRRMHPELVTERDEAVTHVEVRR